MDAKIHIAGTPEGQTQRCQRCHTVLSVATRPADSFWRPGGLIRSRRGGMSLVSFGEAAKVRECGRKGA
jgi:hypothetical protein